jgi:hypothetical protein
LPTSWRTIGTDYPPDQLKEFDCGYQSLYSAVLLKTENLRRGLSVPLSFGCCGDNAQACLAGLEIHQEEQGNGTWNSSIS